MFLQQHQRFALPCLIFNFVSWVRGDRWISRKGKYLGEMVILTSLRDLIRSNASIYYLFLLLF